MLHLLVLVITEDGKMAENAGQFAGMMRFDARIAVLAALKAKGMESSRRSPPPFLSPYVNVNLTLSSPCGLLEYLQ